MLTCVQFPARLESLALVEKLMSETAAEAGLNPSETYALCLSVEEACANIIEHAYGWQTEGAIECTVTDQKNRLIICLRDWGKPFSPTNTPNLDIKAVLNSRGGRGLGLRFITHMMDEVRFEQPPEGGNRVTLIKYKGSGKAAAHG